MERKVSEGRKKQFEMLARGCGNRIGYQGLVWRRWSAEANVYLLSQAIFRGHDSEEIVVLLWFCSFCLLACLLACLQID